MEKLMHLHERVLRIIDECEQTIRDVESWADNRPSEELLDCEWERVMLQQSHRWLEMWDRGVRGARLDALYGRIREHAENA